MGLPEAGPNPSSSITGVFFLLSPSTPEDGANTQAVLREATDVLSTKFGFHSITIQVELHSEDMRHCPRCQEPRE